MTWQIILQQSGIRRWLHCCCEGMDKVCDNIEAFAFEQCSVSTKGTKVSQANTSHTRYTTSSSLNHLYNARVISTASVLFGPNCDTLVFQYWRINLIRSGNAFPIFCCPAVTYSLSFVFWADRRDTLCVVAAEAVCSFISDLWHQQGIFSSRTAVHQYFISLINLRDCAGKSQ